MSKYRDLHCVRRVGPKSVTLTRGRWWGDGYPGEIRHIGRKEFNNDDLKVKYAEDLDALKPRKTLPKGI